MRSNLNCLLEEKSAGLRPEDEDQEYAGPAQQSCEEQEPEPYPHYSQLPSVREMQKQAQESQRATQAKMEMSYQKDRSYQKRREHTGSRGRQYYPASSSSEEERARYSQSNYRNR